MSFDDDLKEFQNRTDQLMQPQRLRILLIDDDSNCIGLIKRELRGDDVIVAYSGEEGLQILETMWKTFDVLIIDEHMPGGLAGHEVIRQVINRWNDTLGKRTILISGMQMTDEQLADIQHWEHPRFLLKPITRTKVLTAIEQVTVQ